MTNEGRIRRGRRIARGRFLGARDEIARMLFDIAKGALLALLAPIVLQRELPPLIALATLILATSSFFLGVWTYSGQREGE